jgi:hypothetical protein
VRRFPCYEAKRRFASEARLRSTKRLFASGARHLEAPLSGLSFVSFSWALIGPQLAPAADGAARRR